MITEFLSRHTVNSNTISFHLTYKFQKIYPCIFFPFAVMSQTLLWALGLALLAVARADNPISYYIESQDFPFDEIPEDTISRNDQRVYRLPTSVVPVEYDIHINLFFAERTEKPFSYEGFETITVEVSHLLALPYEVFHGFLLLVSWF